MLDKKFQGLTDSDVKKRQLKYGFNEIKNVKGSILKVFLNQIDSPLIYLLILSAVICFGTGDPSDGFVITVILFINTALGFYQEYKSTKMFESLQSFITSTATVIRNGKELEINKREIVPDDIVKYKLGDIVSADCYVLEQENLIVDESTLTGESQDVYKNTLDSEAPKAIDDKYIIYSGSTIKNGLVTAKVFAIGQQSKFGHISELSLKTVKKSEYVENLFNLSKWFTVISVISLIFILGAHIILDHNTSFIELLLFTMAIAITIIPEALPVVSTLALTRGALRLSHRHKVIVKQLSAIQDLGNVDIICTDKTGTLTKNILSLYKYTSKNKKDLFHFSTLLSYGSKDPFDDAIYKFALSQSDNKKHIDDIEKFSEIPFDPKLRISGRKFSKYIIYKGSPENIIHKYATEDEKNAILEEINELSECGYRDISIAIEDLEDKSKSRYLGTYFFEDEVKEDASKAIQAGHRQNIKFKIITGDSYNVALHVGKEVCLVTDNNQVIEASKLSFDNPEKLFKEVDQYSIFARSDPEQKYNIIKALETKYHVGYLGDGINDAPSLKVSNVGMVVDTASDIAKSSADIILLTKNLDSIVNGIVEGRKVFVNLDKYLKHTLSSNFGNLYTIGLISLFLNFLPLLPIQILVNNLLSDIPCLALATDNTERFEIKKPKHHTVKNLIEFSILLGAVSSVFDIIFFIWANGHTDKYIQTMSFLFATLTELAVLFSMRTRKFIFKGSKPSKLLILLVFVSTAITLLMVGTAWKVLDLVNINLSDYFIIFLIIAVYVIISEISKLLFYKYAATKDM